ncbi:DUF1127 domain-containing protein [Limimaricola litoreus]|uniref:DUF1127 domain-containing protein n=1 Tax=Limimaricola litoreus TaxID=2955316 RepID=A0A9X2FYL6_9RHOB|nr:DUF1127 domain-containing protein [Limimaricola litoreus]MCP1169518.1 DUF1127 domain-containing protein [Limimaricola litoreus]
MYLSIEKNALNRLPRCDHPKSSPGVIRRGIAAAMRGWQRRKMIAALEAMDGRLLRDIGIYRGDIKNVVYGLDDRELRMTPVARTAAKAQLSRHSSFQSTW